MVGDHGQVDPVVGLALYRVAQEALINAGRHAPRARTVVATQVRDDSVELAVAESSTDRSKQAAAFVTPDVEQIMGYQPRTFAAYLKDNASALAGA